MNKEAAELLVGQLAEIRTDLATLNLVIITMASTLTDPERFLKALSGVTDQNNDGGMHLPENIRDRVERISQLVRQILAENQNSNSPR